MTQDKQIFDLIAKEKERQMHGIELIASENFVSEQVMQAMGSVLTNKYAEGKPHRKDYFRRPDDGIFHGERAFSCCKRHKRRHVPYKRRNISY